MSQIPQVRLPNPALDYTHEWGRSMVRACELNFERLFAGSTNYAVASGFYGSFHDETTQTSAATNTAYPMYLRITDEANSVGIVDNTKITFRSRGTYNIQFSAQIDSTSGGTAHVYIWLRQNGVDVPYSATVVSVHGSSPQLVAAWNFVRSVQVGDYLQIMWSTDNTNVRLLAQGATAPVPAIPSVILTVQSI
jgi:hypothetical protein